MARSRRPADIGSGSVGLRPEPGTRFDDTRDEALNFIKRALHSLRARFGRSLLLTGLFFVICALVLCGLLLRAATDSAADAAKQEVGSDVTLQWDMDKAMEEGGFTGQLPDNAVLDTDVAERVGDSPLVTGHNYTLEGGTTLPDLDPVANGEPPDDLPEEMRQDNMLPLWGTRDAERLHDFKTGRHKILDGRGVTADDADDDVVMIEERLAKQNKLSVGDEVKLTAADGSQPRTFEVIGIYRDPTESPRNWTSPQTEPGNRMIVPVEAIGRMSAEEMVGDAMRVNEAVYELKDPADLDAFRAHAADSGVDMDVFTLDANDKMYRQLVGPIEGVAGFATVGVWLIAIAGAAILALLVMMGVRERRTELGVLLSIGERRWRLVGQQLAEVAVVAAVALGLALAVGQPIAQWAGDALLADELAAVDDEPKPEPQAAGGGRTTTGDDTPAADPVDELAVDMGTADALAIAGIGLGIAGCATVLPTLTILRYQPRSILAKGE